LRSDSTGERGYHMEREQILAIDIGTTGTKSVIFDGRGNPLASATREYSVDIPCPAYAEQDPNLWWEAVVSTVKEVLASPRVRRERIVGVGLSGQMHTSVLLDKHNKVLRPSITWMDQRSVQEVERLKREFGIKELLRMTANFPAPMYTASHLLWIKEHEPDVYRRIRKVLVAKDYVKFLLTGEFSTDPSEASGTYLFDVINLRWAHDLVQYLGLHIDSLPSLSESTMVIGKVTPEAARVTGIPEGTPVVAGSADQAAGAIGGGAVEEGRVSSLIGTAGVVAACSRQPQVDPELRMLCWAHAVPKLWQILGVMQTAAAALKWFRDAFGENDDYAQYDLIVEQVPPGAGGLIFLPYLMGERSPYWDPKARGILFGLRLYHRKPHIIRAIYEGVAYGISHLSGIMRQMRIPVNEIRALGGGNKSTIWRQIQADVTGIPVLYPDALEGSAFGAAILAAVGVGLFATIQEATDRLVTIVDRREPDLNSHRIYSALREIYVSLYEANKELFQKLDAIVADRTEDQL